ncbi:aminopeptidase N [Silanimonas sp.]|uniref:aminopeptidase N n=1 Tax=Silanimonas sp. TaxID=1929290 RepID=UPI0022C6E55D|nr:aminopeptidase N [Silanimonas sp.]MCZ8115757.1 aminopeptidase N [Silanimonas sp.]
MTDQVSPPIRLLDYRPPAWTITDVALVFELERESSVVEATLALRCDEPGSALRLDGEELELLAIALDGRPLAAEEFAHDATGLVVHATRGAAACTLHTVVRVKPAANTRLEGLYTSGSLLLTQCEAEGFRRITFFVDRPDVQARWRTTLRAERARYPVLLAGGDRVAERDLGDGRHEAEWHNPHPTPCYLFALAAGPMARVSKAITGADGRAIELNVWVEGDDAEPCRYALGAVERALRWDESRFGRCYDLGVFNVVAAQDFTMGAMENKGLNIFNARYILADERTATDADFMGIESVVGHEYFHNWSGNRVTLRDWFQLSLKEGLTVFRDQEFTADLHSRDLKRIDDVRLLRARQFAEDAGALAHPVRPAEYREINNFYTLTIYEKGAEIVRMLHSRLGEAAFRAGMDRYFADNDGRSATLEDFYAAHSAATGIDCTDMLAWYAQAGTPVLDVERSFDSSTGEYTLVLRQRPPANVPAAAPLPVPMRLALYDAAGHALPAPSHDAEAMPDGLLLRHATHTLRWRGLSSEPLPVLNRGFAAPIRLRMPMPPEERARIVQVESDGFARWDALQHLALDVLLARADEPVDGLGDVDAAENALSAAIGALLADTHAHPAFVAECLALPDFDTLADAVAVADPGALVAARERLSLALATVHRAALQARFDALRVEAAGGLDDAAMAARSLRHAALAWLSKVDGGAAARGLWDDARSMTERMAALRALLHVQAAGAAAAREAFAAEFADHALVTDKWLAVVATRPAAEALDDVEALVAGPCWNPTNPNRVRAIVGSLARLNPAAFHRGDGAGYRFVAAQVQSMDAINPQVAARLLGAFEGLPRWTAPARAAALAALAPLRSATLSRDVAELLGRLPG